MNRETIVEHVKARDRVIVWTASDPDRYWGLQASERQRGLDSYTRLCAGCDSGYSGRGGT
jgi:hypothetical protein